VLTKRSLDDIRGDEGSAEWQSNRQAAVKRGADWLRGVAAKTTAKKPVKKIVAKSAKQTATKKSAQKKLSTRLSTSLS